MTVGLKRVYEPPSQGTERAFWSTGFGLGG